MYDTITDPDEDPSFYYNHSCDPNTWYATATCMVALRDIHPGEHVTYDYACTETEGSMHAGLHCRCGAACCRDTLTFTEWRSHDWQRRFAGHCSAYIERKMAESGWYDPRVVPRYKGGADGFKGMFALASVRRGEPLLVFAGKLVGLDYLLGSDERTRELSLRVNDHLWQVPHPTRGPETPDFINHSCDPNCGLEDSVTVVALRDIVQGEELSIDYGSTNAGVVRTSSDNFSCHCGASICRGVVTCDDWQLLELQQRLWPFFPPFIKRLIVRESEQSDSKPQSESAMPPRRSARSKGKEKLSDDEPMEDPPYVAWMKEQQKQGKPSPSIKRIAKTKRDSAGASTSSGPGHDDDETGGDTDVSNDDLEEIVSESDSDADSDNYKAGSDDEEEDSDGAEVGSGDDRSTRRSKKEKRPPAKRNKRVWLDAELTSLAAARWNTKDDLKAMQGKQGSQYLKKLRAHMVERDDTVENYSTKVVS
ncbi:unnamed protein product [Closterium sp. Naga37s-1]|nr:unnamed protein product [Closterium sp. Naga37s-1]